MRQQQVDRRRQARKRLNLPNAVAIRVCDGTEASRPIIAKLIDASSGGVGVETFTRLRAGTRVLIEATLQSPELALALNGAGLVAHSREIGPGRYVVGLELQDVSYVRAS
jgi:hypothetical protein